MNSLQALHWPDSDCKASTQPAPSSHPQRERRESQLKKMEIQFDQFRKNEVSLRNQVTFLKGQFGNGTDDMEANHTLQQAVDLAERKVGMPYARGSMELGEGVGGKQVQGSWGKRERPQPCNWQSTLLSARHGCWAYVGSWRPAPEGNKSRDTILPPTRAISKIVPKQST